MSRSEEQLEAAPAESGSHDRALVLAGGGAAGNAWELGLVAGLSAGSVDVLEADLVVGTSAGSTVAAQITSGTALADLYAAVLAEVPQPPVRAPGPGRQGSPRHPGAGYLDWSNRVIASAVDPGDMRRRLGAAAIEMDASRGTAGTRWREIVALRLPSHDWPERRMLITAVDADTGEPVTFDRRSGVELVDAVAASTSAMIAYRIGERRYLNGGYRRSENADLATGYARVLVLSPFGGRSRMPAAWGMDLVTQAAELRAAGSRVETVFPDAGAGEVFGANALDPSTRRQAARGGYAQGQALAEPLAAFWS